MSQRKAGKYAVPVSELEASVHVAQEDMVTEQGEPPPPAPLSDEELDRQRLLGVTAAGRLRL
jgi:hypothetical protein